jgi:hypothetical protein
MTIDPLVVTFGSKTKGNLIAMSRLDLKRWAWSRAGVVLTLWACLIAAPKAVQADCAHYVISSKDPGRSLAALELKIFADAIGQPEQDPRDASNRPSPCPGGICSRGPDLPLAPAPDPVLIHQWGFLAAHGFPDGPKAASCPGREESVRPIGFRLTVFHPPRLHVSPFGI